MNIILIGGRGSAKTGIAKYLKKKINWPIISLDKEIKRLTNRTIPNIIKKDGWRYFRNLEYQICLNLLNINHHIIDTGGGIVVDLDQNDNEIYSNRKMSILKSIGIIFWLDIPLNLQKEIIKGDKNRPSLTNQAKIEDEIAEIMKRRKPFYNKAANYIIYRSKNNISQNIRNIIKISKKEQII